MNKEKSVSTPIVIAVAIVIVLLGAYLVVSSNQTNPLSVEMPTSNQSSTAATVNVPVSPAQTASTSSAPAPSASASNLKITRPAGGEQWKTGDSYMIRWDGQDFLSAGKGYGFELSLMQGDRGKGVVATEDNGPITGANYLWTIPKDTLPGTYEIEIVEYQLVPCSPSASSTLCRQWAFKSRSNPFAIVSP